MCHGGGNSSNQSHFYGCSFTGNTAGMGGAVWVGGISDITFEGCLFQENSADLGGAITVWTGNADMTSCTLAGNSCDPSNRGGAITLWEEGSSCQVQQSILALNSGGDGGGAIGCYGAENVILVCTDVYGNTGGDWVGCIAGQYPGNGNINEDPIFCGEQNPSSPYSLDAESPCALAECGLMGAFPVACGDYLADVSPAFGPEYRTSMLVSPNPSRGSTAIRFAKGPEPAIVNVHDALGRLVTTLTGGVTLSDGIHEIVWDGREANGAAVSAGVYSIRWRSGQTSGRRSVVILR